MQGVRFWFMFSAVMSCIGAAPNVIALDLSGAYLGGNIGRARTSYDTGFIDGQLNSAAANSGYTLDVTARSIDKMSNAWWVDTGYLMTPYIGIDAAYLHLGDIKYLAAGTLTGFTANQTLSTSNEITSRGPALSLLLRLPLAESFAADLRVGDYYGKATWNNGLTVGSSSSFANTSKSNSSLLAGVGASYSVAGHWSFRIDFLRINQSGDNNNVGKFSVNVGSVGASYTF